MARLPPCEILRAWPETWSVAALLRAGPEAAAPGRYLHPSLAVAPSARTGGRCIVATRPCRAGELVLVDSPLLLAGSRRALLEAAFDRANEDEDFREVLLSLCGDESDRSKRALALHEGFVEAELVGRIVAHNYHVLEPAPRDGSAAETAVCGLWPLGSVVNHSLRPNATRSFAGHANCYRLLRDVSAGEEILDNYLDPRLPRVERVSILGSVHGMADEGPDEHDARAEFLDTVEGERAVVGKLLEEEQTAEAFRLLVAISERCQGCSRRDPAFSEIFRAHAELAAELLGDQRLQLHCLALALDYTTVREPFSTVSCVLAIELLAAAVALGDIERLAWAEAVAREHFEGVYGTEEGLFEILNPEICEKLSRLRPTSTEPELPLQPDAPCTATCTTAAQSPVNLCLDAMD